MSEDIKKKMFNVSVATAAGAAMFLIYTTINIMNSFSEIKQEVALVQQEMTHKADHEDLKVVETELQNIKAIVLDIQSKLK